MNVKDLCVKLSHTNWMPYHASKYISNWAGLEGQLNLAWVLSGRPTRITPAFFNTPHWTTAYKLGQAEFKGYPVREFATLLSQDEFLKMSMQYPQVIQRFVDLSDWQRAFKQKKVT